MSGFKRQCAVLIGLCITQLGFAYHYPIYQSVKSTAYFPIEHNNRQDQQANVAIDFHKTPYKIIINSTDNDQQQWPFVFSNNSKTALTHIRVSAVNNLLHFNQASCQAQLLPGKQCQLMFSINKDANTNIQHNMIVPVTIHFLKGDHPFAQQFQLQIIQSQAKRFYHMPQQQFANKHGIASNFLRALFMDQHHHLMIGTDSGLSEGLADNQKFITYNNTNNLNNDITAIVKDPAGTLYIGTNQGLSISNDNGLTFTTKTRSNGLSGNRIRALFWSGHCLYVGTNHGLNVSCDQGQSFQQRGLSEGLGSLTINQIAQDHLGHLFVATDNGLAESDNNGLDFHNMTTNYGLGDNAVNTIAIDQNNRIYAGTENGLSISNDDGQSFKNYNTNQGLLSNRILSLAIDPNNHNVFVGTDCGLNIKRPNHNNFYSQNPGCMHNAGVSDIVVDPQQQIVYLATKGNGLGEFNVALSSIKYVKSDAIEDSMINGLQVAGQHIFVSTDKGISQSDNAGQTFQTWMPKQNDVTVLSGLQQDKQTYVGTDQGLYMSDDLQHWQHVLKDFQINTIYINPITKQLLVGTPQGLIVSNDNGQHYTQHTIDDGLLEDNVNHILLDPINHILYIITDHGVSYSYDNGQTFKAIHFNHLLKYPQVNGFALSPLGVLYVATNQGLLFGYWVNNQLHWQIKTHKNGLVSDNVTSIDIDVQGQKMLVGCQGGISISNDGGLHFSNYTQGLQNTMPIAAAYNAQNHNVLVATRNNGLLKAHFD